LGPTKGGGAARRRRSGGGAGHSCLAAPPGTSNWARQLISADDFIKPATTLALPLWLGCVARSLPVLTSRDTRTRDWESSCESSVPRLGGLMKIGPVAQL